MKKNDKTLVLIIVFVMLLSLACQTPFNLTVTPSPILVQENQEPTLTPFMPVEPTQSFTITPPASEPTLAPSPEPTAAYQPVFEPASCPNNTFSGYSVDCGYLVVPEDRFRPDSQMIRLAINIYHSWAQKPAPDPVVHLAGGPGSSSLGTSIYMLSTGFDRILQNRDLIFIDQRGTGYSLPLVDCPEREQIAPVLLEGNMLPDESLTAVIDSFARCRDRLQSGGINLSMYNSAQSAADIADLRRALGYDFINLYGDSYGTRLALTIMRDNPQGIRSVVLDSVYPPQANLYTELARNADRAFRVFFDRCAADSACSSSYPNLEGRFYDLVRRLNETPIIVSTSGHDIRLTGNLLIDVLFVGLYNRVVMLRMPEMIAQVEAGSYTLLRPRLDLYFDTASALGMQMSVQCREEIPFGTMEEMQAASEGVRAEIAETFAGTAKPLFEFCPNWGVPPAEPVENQSVSSDIPSLILAGEVDPITPPDWGVWAAETLPNSYYYLFPGMGHWVARSSPCAIEMILLFLDNPARAPESGCL
ncbi:MAG: alpha/beta fold hydrolase [Chloroflexi bacterium]|nr:MAG: alpha/beta fold hydrolase [Chloroflexota bacterium]